MLVGFVKMFNNELSKAQSLHIRVKAVWKTIQIFKRTVCARKLGFSSGHVLFSTFCGFYIVHALMTSRKKMLNNKH